MIFSSQYFHFPSLLGLQSFLSKRTSSIYLLYSYPLLSPLQSGYYPHYPNNFLLAKHNIDLAAKTKEFQSIFLGLSLAFNTIDNSSLASLKLLVSGPPTSLDVLSCIFASSPFKCLHFHKVPESVLFSSYSIPFLLGIPSTSMDCHSL